jgi:hypothetical protein
MNILPLTHLKNSYFTADEIWRQSLSQRYKVDTEFHEGWLMDSDAIREDVDLQTDTLVVLM